MLGSSVSASAIYKLTLCAIKVPIIINPKIVKQPGISPPIQSLSLSILLYVIQASKAKLETNPAEYKY